MNAGVVRKAIREAWAVTVLLAIAIGAAEGLLSYALPTIFSRYSEQLLQLPFVQRIVAGFLGADIRGPITEEMVRLFGWVHPVVLAILWAHVVWHGTRLPAAEVDRGTIDLLLCLPVSRWSLYVSDSMVTFGSGVLLVVCALAGNVIASQLGRSATGGTSRAALPIAANCFCLHVAVAGLAYLVSSLSDRRGRAVAAIVVVLLTSFLLNFLAQFWEPIRSADVLSILHYYRPMQIAMGNAWPIRDMAVLAGAGFVLWLFGAAVFIRRDFRTT